jgi:hypothetical protein
MRAFEVMVSRNKLFESGLETIDSFETSKDIGFMEYKDVSERSLLVSELLNIQFLVNFEHNIIKVVADQFVLDIQILIGFLH